MSTVSAAFSEIARVAPWSLRALGFHPGVAERGAILITVAEALGYEALRALRLEEVQLVAAAGSATSARRRKACGGVAIDAKGKSLIEVGLPTIDLVAGLSGAAWGRASISGVIDPALLEPVLALAGMAGISAFGLCRSKANGDANSCWSASLACGSEILLSGGSDLASRELFAALASNAGVPLPAFTSAVLDGVAESRIDLCVRADLIRVAAPPDCVRILNVSERVQAAHAQGITVSKVDLDHLYALERRTWAPSSERSLAQAGFQSS